MTDRDVIAVDIDEVLAYFIPTLASFHNEVYGSDSSSVLTPDSFFSYEFHKVWGGNQTETMEKMEQFFESIHFKERIFPVSSAFHVLQELKKDYELHIVTARLHKLEDITRQWIHKYFPNTFADIHFGNHYSTSGKSRSKVEMCKMISAKLLIDDSLVYAMQCVKQGIKVILFGDYAWNQVNHSVIDVHNPHMIGGTSAIDSAASGITKVAASVLNKSPAPVTPTKESALRSPLSVNTLGSGIKNTILTPVNKSLLFNSPVKEYSPPEVEEIDDVCVVKYNDHLFPAENGKHVVYRVTHWEKIQRLIYQLLPPKHTISDRIGKESKELEVYALQLSSVNDKRLNLLQIETLLQDISSKHWESSQMDSPLSGNDGLKSTVPPRLVCLPECCLFLGNTSEETLENAECLFTSDENNIMTLSTSASPSFEALSQLAKEYQIWLSVGGFPERNPQKPEKMYNTHFVITPEGMIAPESIYRKIHLFDCPLIGLQESKVTDPGQDLRVIDIQGWKIGLTICYDLRFPTFYQKLRDYYQLDCILIPSAFTVPTGKAHWEVLLRARAIENQSYVIAAAQSGHHNPNRESYGHSMIVDPWGTIESQLNTELNGYCHSTLTKQRLQEIRDKMPVQSHRREDLY